MESRRLDQVPAPTAAVALNAQKITGLADPTSAQDAATKAYVDSSAALTTKRVSIPCGAEGNSAITTVPDLNPRQLVAVPETTVRWRLRIRNYLCANTSPVGVGSGVFSITGLGIGTPLFPAVTSTATSGRWAGKSTAAMTATIAAATLTDATEYTSEWITDSTMQWGPVPRVASLGLKTASGTWKYGGDTAGGFCYQATNAADNFLTAAPALAGANITCFDWRLEMEFLTSKPVVFCIGDSITKGAAGGDLGPLQYEAWPCAAGLRNGFFAINGGVIGSGTGNWNTGDAWIYSRHDLATTVPDVAIIACGSPNDSFVSGSAANIVGVQAKLVALGIKRIYLGMPIPDNYGAGNANETARLALAAWGGSLPTGIEGVIPFDRVIESTADISLGDTRMFSSPPHPLRRGYAAMAGVVPKFTR